MNRFKYRSVVNFVGATVVALPMLCGNAQADDKITAGSLLERLSAGEQVSYLSGLIEGLAYARYEREGTATGGAACINKWFYETEGTLRKIMSAFDHFADYTPGAVVAAMIEKDCGA